MWEKEINLDNVIQHYRDSFSEYGDTAKGANWKDKNSQLLRFKVLINGIGIEKLNGSIVADLGCGAGALLDFFYENSISIEKYIGYDIVKEILDFSAKKFKNHKISNQWVVSQNPTILSDYTITSGIFNVKFCNEDSEWFGYVCGVIQSMHMHSKKGYAFNFLRDNVDWRAENLYYANIETFREYCQALGAKKVNLIEDYGLYEWTIIVEK